MPKLGTILLIEPDDVLREPLTATLARQEYHLLSTAVVEEARYWLNQQAVHIDLAIIAVSHSDHGRDCLTLVQELDPQIHKLLTSAEIGVFDGLRLANKTHFFNKERGRDELLNEITHIFRQYIRLNQHLIIEPSGDCQLSDLVRMIKPYRDLSDNRLDTHVRELKRLLQRIFFREAKIVLTPLSPGKGGAGVVRITPYYRVTQSRFHQGAEIVLKFGLREALVHELGNYREYVETFTGMQATDVLGDIMHTRHLAGVKFRFLGANKAPVREWAEVFADRSLPDTLMAEIVNQMFRDSCALWYANKYPPEPEGAPSNLEIYYDDQLDVFDAESWAEMVSVMAELLSGELFDRATAETLAVNLPHGREFGPDPLYFLAHQRHRLPPTTFCCITHGDVNERNIFVDGNFDTWLLDFTRTGPSTAVRDLVQLESVIKFHLLPHENVPLLLAFEKWLNEPETFSAFIQRTCPFPDPWLQRAFTTLQAVRQFTAELLETDDMREYEAGLLFQAIKMITRTGLTQAAVQRRRSRQRHALYAAMQHAESMSNEQ